MRDTYHQCDEKSILRWLSPLRWQCTGCGCVVRGFAGYPGRLEIVEELPKEGKQGEKAAYQCPLDGV